MPSRVEVWKSRDDYKTRLHDRIVFTQSNDAWIKTRLYP
jgi:pyridoxine/pyridoxamine 5'-phosphate oxidase